MAGDNRFEAKADFDGVALDFEFRGRAKLRLGHDWPAAFVNQPNDGQRLRLGGELNRLSPVRQENRLIMLLITTERSATSKFLLDRSTTASATATRSMVEP